MKLFLQVYEAISAVESLWLLRGSRPVHDGTAQDSLPEKWTRLAILQCGAHFLDIFNLAHGKVWVTVSLPGQQGLLI